MLQTPRPTEKHVPLTIKVGFLHIPGLFAAYSLLHPSERTTDPLAVGKSVNMRGTFLVVLEQNQK